MSKDVLSQEEIDALLRSVEAEEAAVAEPEPGETDAGEDGLPPLETMELEVLKALGEVLAGVLQQVGAKGIVAGEVTAVPDLSGGKFAGFRFQFEGVLSGSLYLYLPVEFEGEGETWVEAMEVGVGSLVDGEVKAELEEGVAPSPLPLGVGQGLWLPYEGEERGPIWAGIPLELLESTLAALHSQVGGEAAPEEATARAAKAPAARPAPEPAPAPIRKPKAAEPRVPVQRATFRPLPGSNGSGGSQNIDLLLDVPLDLRVELGRTKKSIRDVLALGPGSVIELDRLAGEAVDVMVNGKLIAKGEVVVIDESFGIRVTDIVSRVERINRLR